MYDENGFGDMDWFRDQFDPLLFDDEPGHSNDGTDGASGGHHDVDDYDVTGFDHGFGNNGHSPETGSGDNDHHVFDPLGPFGDGLDGVNINFLPDQFSVSGSQQSDSDSSDQNSIHDYFGW